MRGRARLRPRRGDERNDGRWGDFLDAFTYFDDLHGAGGRMGFDAPPLGPGIGLVVMVDIGEEQARCSLVDNDAQVATDADRPEIWVLRTVNAVKLQPGPGGIELKIEGARLNRLLFLRGQLRERVRESVGDAEVH